MADEQPTLAVPEGIPKSVAEQLSRLDPWSFWAVRLPGGEVAVIGTTGAFLVWPHDAEGRLHVGGRRVTVGGRPVARLWRHRRMAKGLRAQLASWAVYTHVEPVLCLTRALAGGPRTVAGVAVVPVGGLARHVSGRSTVLNRDRAKRGAERLAGRR